MAGNFFGGQFFGGGFFGAVDADTGVRPSGGFPADREYGRTKPRTKEELAEARERVGIPNAAKEIIRAVAAQQAERLEQDQQKQLDELRGELKLRNLELEAGYLEALAEEREALISAEIAARLIAKIRLQQNDEEMLMMLTLIAAAV